jgi:hypothetical protein
MDFYPVESTISTQHCPIAQFHWVFFTFIINFKPESKTKNSKRKLIRRTDEQG